ncbi:hypothetical protein Ancab_016617 [Ancistrocladus abbreviatus]
MALHASTVNSCILQAKLLSAQLFPRQHFVLLNAGNPQISRIPTTKLLTAQFRVPDKVKVYVKVAKDRLWNSVPPSVKGFPWKKAEDIFLERLQFLLQKAFKWSFVAWCFLSFFSDFVFTISRNQELVMPFGLFLGCLLTDFMRETSQVLFQHPEEKDLKWYLVGIGSFCVVLKLIAMSFAIQGRVLLLHIANGGLMQILWLWRGLIKDNQDLYDGTC